MADRAAQTNLQLYNQLIARSWSYDDLRRARVTYEFVDRMFAGRRRRSGKPFIAHLVGTASVAADVDGRPDIVLGALLHSVYTLGGSSISSRAPTRSTIRSLVGTASEALVYEYASRPWGPDAFADAIVNVAEFDRTRRDVVLLRLVNEVDEHADFGTRYRGNVGFLRADDEALVPMAELADRLECPKLAATFRRLFEEERGVDVPDVLRASTRTSTVDDSRPHLSRLSISVRTLTGRGRRLIMSVPGTRSAVHALRRLRSTSRSPAAH